MVDRFQPESLVALLCAVSDLREVALQHERQHASWLEGVPEPFRASARNLLHYLGVRGQDLRPLQTLLARLGLSSLGRMEGNVLDTLDAVLSTLHVLSGRPPPPDRGGAAGLDPGRQLLSAYTDALFGPPPADRSVRIMVTLPSEAARDGTLVRRLVAAGMDVARINLAHDDAATWTQMVQHVRAAAGAAQRSVRVQADLGGPKLRTGAMSPGPEVLRLQPRRDEVGIVTQLLRLWLHAEGDGAAPPGTAAVPVSAELLAAARVGDELLLTDGRGRVRRFRMQEAHGCGRFCEGDRTVYLRSGTELKLRRGKRTVAFGAVGRLPALPGHLLLHQGDEFLLTRAATPGQPATPGGGLLARIPCELPAVFERARLHQPVWFDDGRLGGKVVARGDAVLRIQVTSAPPNGFRLRAGKGINLPETDLVVPALTARDRACLDWVAAHADLVGLSFTSAPDDVRELHRELANRNAAHLGVVLKIETARAFARLPALLLAGLCSPPLGVMVARGDLAVEVGFARLAEVQEEILWLCEAAHVPVIWATQVLETLARRGQPSRAEVTDAAMAVRAEGVMLNKGPYAVEAVQFLGSVLQRMRAHQDKKRSMLRRLLVVDGLGASHGGATGEPAVDRAATAAN